MEKLKVAVLEDNRDLLKDLIETLKETKLVDIVFHAANSEDFLEKSKVNLVDALILDIDLNGDSMSGIDVANKMKLPVLFVSGKSRDFIERVEELNLNNDFPIESITKPISLEKLAKILPKFSQRISLLNKARFVYLDFKHSKRNKIDIDKIVFLESETGTSGESNNKRIYFANRKPETLIDFSFVKMSQKGLDESKFVTPHKSYRINVEYIKSYHSDHVIDFDVIDDSGTKITKQIRVSDNYRSDFRKYRSK